MTVQERIVTLLHKRGWTLTCAESCTGGMIVSRIVEVAGASEVLNVSFVTYASAAKEEYLAIEPATIIRCGVVSETVAAQMATGAAKRAGAQVAIGVTGYAGPGGGTEDAPAGTVCFGFYIDGAVTACRMSYGDIGRMAVRRRATTFALKKLASLLQNA